MRAPPTPLRLLILGGTTEASRLAARLAGDPTVAPTLSLAGRTQAPVLPPIPVRIGGFGGVAGLTDFLAEGAIEAVIDATHPFAARISAHAAEACARLAVPRALFTRPAWVAEAGDRWTNVPDLLGAAAVLGPAPMRVFLTTGRLGLSAFATAPQHHYVGRTIDAPEPADRPPRYVAILDRGPFMVESEIDLMHRETIAVLVTKNSGGAASRPKLLAARALGLPVVMVDRPPMPEGAAFTALAEVERWIEAQRAAP